MTLRHTLTTMFNTLLLYDDVQVQPIQFVVNTYKLHSLILGGHDEAL